MQIRKNLVRITTFSYLSFFIVRLLTFLFITLAFYKTGKNFLGLWIFTIAFIGYFKYVLGSLKQSFMKDLSKQFALNDFLQLKKIFKGSFIIMIFVGFVLAICVLLFGFFALGQFFKEREFVSALRIAFVFISGYVLLSSITIPFQALLGAKQKNEIVHILDSLQAILNTIFSISIILVYPSMKLIVLVYFLVQLLVSFIYFILEKDFFTSTLCRDIKLPEWLFLKQQLYFSFYLFLFSIAMIVLFQIDVMLVAYFLPTALIAIYGVCQKIYCLPMDLSMSITSGILPATSFLHGKRDDKSISELFFMGTKYSMIIYFPIGISLFIYAYPILSAWLGKEFADSGTMVLRILLAHQWFNINHCVGVYMLKGIGKVKELLIYSWLCSALNLSLSIILIHRFNLVGLALGTTVPFILLEFYILKHLFNNLKILWGDYIKRVIIPIYIPMFSVLIVYMLFIKVVGFNIIGTILGAGLTSILMFAIYILGLNKEEKSPIFHFIEQFNFYKQPINK